MNWDQNKELVEQILRTGMYAKLYDEETTYGYLTYLTYRVEDALFTWKKESDVDGFWADLTWEEYIAFLRREKSLVLAAQRVLLNTVIAFPASAFDFTLEEAEVDFPVSVYKTAGLGCTLGHQIMSCILPLGRGIILRFELFQGLTNALTAAQQSQIREIETAYKLLEIFQETLFICHSTHHLERMRP